MTEGDSRETGSERSGSRTVNIELPGDDTLLAAAGSVALVHGQLELALRMTIKTLSRLSVREALDATEGDKNWALRAQVNKLFKQHTRDELLRMRMKAVLGKCKALSEKRNRLIHRAWAIDSDGSVVVKGGDHYWGPAPRSEDLKMLAEEIAEQVRILNQERLHGFIAEVIGSSDSSSR